MFHVTLPGCIHLFIYLLIYLFFSFEIFLTVGISHHKNTSKLGPTKLVNEFFDRSWGSMLGFFVQDNFYHYVTRTHGFNWCEGCFNAEVGWKRGKLDVFWCLGCCFFLNIRPLDTCNVVFF